MKTLLVVFHSRTGGAEAMADAVIGAARSDEIDGLDVVVRRAFDADVDDVVGADAIILGTPENFGYMSGALKDFLERIYHPCLDRTRGRPYGLFVRAGNDGTGTVTSVERIVAGLAWKQVQPPVVAAGELHQSDLDRCAELGGSIAAGLAFDLF